LFCRSWETRRAGLYTGKEVLPEQRKKLKKMNQTGHMLEGMGKMYDQE
jgi:hypothetical protein